MLSLRREHRRWLWYGGCASPHAFRASSCAISNEDSSIRGPPAEIESLRLRLLPLRLRSGLKAGSARKDKARVIVKYAGTRTCVIARNEVTKQSLSVRRLFVIIT